MAMRRYDLAGRTVLITGAARGIGLEIAGRVHGRGANVALTGLEPELLEQRASELGERAWWQEADVTDLAAMQAAADGAAERFGGIDVVVANAGVAPNGSVASIDPAAFDRTIEVNLLGVFRTVRAALPHVTARAGHVLVVSSASAIVHTPLMAAYTASKAGVEAFANALRVEVAHTGTKVGVAYFSFIDTDMVRRGFDRPSAQLGRSRLRGFEQIAPLSDAGEAVLAGIERRARHIAVPRYVLPMLYARSLLQPLAEWQARRHGIAEVVEVAEQEPSELTTPQPEQHAPTG